MARVPSIRLGNYGNGTIGLKCSISPHDVTVLADDNNTERRSFNSEWTNLCKVKLIGTATPIWVPYQERFQSRDGGVGGLYNWRSWSISGWRAVPAEVPTGLSYMPIWEERLYDFVARRIYDDFVYPGTSGATGSASGARSYFSGPGKAPANTIFFEPFLNAPIIASPSAQFETLVNSSMIGEFVVRNPGSNVNVAEPAEYPPYPPYPAYPAEPVQTLRSIYVVYSNKLGDIS